MSIQAVGWALEQELPARPKLVLVAICNHANHTNGYCWLKAETIAKEASCTARSVYNFVGVLIRNGFIRKALRRGDDGKQRATDYWVLFTREEKPWVSGANKEGDEAESEPDESVPTEADDATSGVPDAPGAGGEVGAAEPVDKHVHSCGPPESTFTRYKDEPSNTKPKERLRGPALPHEAALRSYRPPPPQPVGDVFNEAKEIFVFEGTRAYDAWAKVKAKENGIRTWHLTARRLVEGKWRSGWPFPSLFPPETKSTGPPETLSEEDARAFTGD